MITIVNYGMGNLGSILNMLKKVGAVARVSSDANEIRDADKLILPGVGAFDTGMKRLKELDLIGVLNEKVLKQQTPTIGLCLGMQLLTNHSEEGSMPGLGWIDGETVRFRFNPKITNQKIPHMGWNTITIKTESKLFQEIHPDARFYFVHSYHVVCHREEDVAAATEYGYEFASVIQRGNVMGTQFHPEKSHKFGMKLLKNFVELV